MEDVCGRLGTWGDCRAEAKSQKPDVRSMVENILECFRPISMRQSSTVRIVYLSGRVAAFSLR